MSTGCNTVGRANKTQTSMVQEPISDSTILQADFSQTENQIGTVFDFFDVSVRTHKGSPNSTPATFGRRAKVNTVRMLGGWSDKNLEADTYKWDGEKYVYDFEQATKRIDSWLAKDWDIFQIVLDNPPWAFQHGFTFVDTPNGVNYLKKDQVGVYGNPLPPNDANAWQQYIHAFMQHLVATYGEEKVLQWRFRVGSEIDTRPQHWAATRQAFFDHYQNTVTAVHAVLPDAQIGVHFREASFTSKYIDYTGNTEDSYATHFVSWAKKYNVPYDFFAVSYYPHITKKHELDMQRVYQHDMAPITEHPDFNANASFEIHEFKFIIKMKRAGFESVATSHASAFFAMLSKLMLEKNIQNVFQWGTAKNGSYIPEAMTQLALHPMVGNQLYANQVIRKPQIAGNLIDGIFTKHPDKDLYQVLTFNFNKDNLDYQQAEQTQIKVVLDKPAGTKYRYRVANIDSSNNIDQMFANDFPKANILQSQGGWRKAGVHQTASLNSALNEQGKKVYNANKGKYGKSNKLLWSDWLKGNTIASETLLNDTIQSSINIDSKLASFAVQSYEIQLIE
nr:hypothetical protein [Paraglaciecola sp. G1-23]